jgi:hypothetical protein
VYVILYTLHTQTPGVAICLLLAIHSFLVRRTCWSHAFYICVRVPAYVPHTTLEIMTVFRET